MSRERGAQVARLMHSIVHTTGNRLTDEGGYPQPLIDGDIARIFTPGAVSLDALHISGHSTLLGF